MIWFVRFLLQSTASWNINAFIQQVECSKEAKPSTILCAHYNGSWFFLSTNQCSYSKFCNCEEFHSKLQNKSQKNLFYVRIFDEIYSTWTCTLHRLRNHSYKNNYVMTHIDIREKNSSALTPYSLLKFDIGKKLPFKKIILILHTDILTFSKQKNQFWW